MEDKINLDKIKKHIKSTAFADNIHIYDTLCSTNTTAKELAENDNAPHGTLVLAQQQSAGKGRLGRSFHSPIGTGIYMSVILRLDYDIENSLKITSAASVAVCRAIKLVYNVDTQIKWVNDVFLNNKKICGILTEASVNPASQALNYIVVGIGINICTDDFPEQIADAACSLFSKEEYSGKPEREILIAEVINQLEIICESLSCPDSGVFLDDYRRFSCIIGSDINVIMPNKPIYQARAIDINNDGHLIVQMSDGSTSELSCGEISIRKIQ